jgi:putative ABC transport system permease protein
MTAVQMHPWETIRVAARALLRNKMRSFLTALGIIIGVAAVIAMVAIGEGARSRVEQAFAAMGTNVLIVSSGAKTAGGANAGAGTLPTLTWEDMKAIRSEVAGVRFVAPRVHTTGQVVSEDGNWSTLIDGTTDEFFEIRNWPMRLGAPFAPEDVDGGAKTVILGQTVAERLFGASADPVGQTVRIQNVPFQVIGVAGEKGQSPGGSDYDDVVFVPVSTFLAKIQGSLQKYIPGTILVEVEPDQTTADVADRIAALLRDRHEIPLGDGGDDEIGDDDFTIKDLTETASRKEESAQALTLLLASIAAVSLAVGGIGIMNIMLVSVTERTREIGVRMAVGAKPRHILAQFLTEALTLSAAGGLGGVALGLAVAARLAARFRWPMLVRPEVIALAVGFSALVGVVFGLYPARKASRLDPILALRYE